MNQINCLNCNGIQNIRCVTCINKYSIKTSKIWLIYWLKKNTFKGKKELIKIFNNPKMGYITHHLEQRGINLRVI